MLTGLHHRPELYAGDHHASGRHHRRHPDHPGLQLRSRTARPGEKGPALHLPFKRRIHHDPVYPGPDCGTPLRASVHLGPGPDRRGCKDHKDLHPGSNSLKHPVCDRRRLHWPWKGPAFPASVLFPEAGLLPSALSAAPVLRSQSHLLRGAHFRHHRPCGIHLHIRRGHEADLKKASDPQLLRTAGWVPALPGHIREMPAGQASLVILTQLPAPYIQKNTAIPPFREFWQCFLLQLFLLVVVLLALGDCESESLSRHLVACQIFIVGGDLIH